MQRLAQVRLSHKEVILQEAEDLQEDADPQRAVEKETTLQKPMNLKNHLQMEESDMLEEELEQKELILMLTKLEQEN